MARYVTKSFDSPDEARNFDKGKLEAVKLGGQKAARITLTPGWRWTESLRPVVGTPTCQSHHLGYVVAGTIHIAMDEGDSFEVRAGEAYEVQPGHDAWVVGDEQFVALEFEPKTAEGYAKP